MVLIIVLIAVDSALGRGDLSAMSEMFDTPTAKPSMAVILGGFAVIFSAFVFAYVALVFGLIRAHTAGMAWRARRRPFLLAAGALILGPALFVVGGLLFGPSNGPVLERLVLWLALPVLLCGLVATMVYVYAAATRILFVRATLEDVEAQGWPQKSGSAG